jgi:hypothetical protein
MHFEFLGSKEDAARLRKKFSRNKFRVTARKTRVITGGKRARAWAALMRGRKFTTTIKELD